MIHLIRFFSPERFVRARLARLMIQGINMILYLLPSLRTVEDTSFAHETPRVPTQTMPLSQEARREAQPSNR